MTKKNTWIVIALTCVIIASGIMVYNSDNFYLSSKNLVTANIPARLFSNSQTSFLILANNIEGVPSQDTVTVDVVLEEKTLHLYQGKMDENGYVKPLFAVPNITGEGELVVTVGDEQIREDVSIVDTHQILISTDKPLYQPGQTIHIRMLTYENIDPVASDDSIELSIVDPDGNLMEKKFLQPNEYGVTNFDFYLSDQLSLGNYEITARVGGEETQRMVMVEKYVLPKFNIEIEDMKSWYLINESITGIVSCKYFFGKDVEGNVSINVSTYLGVWKNVSGIKGTLTNGKFAFTLSPIEYSVALPVWNQNGVVQLQITVEDTGGHMENETHILPLASNSLVITTLADNNIIDALSNYYVIVRDPRGAAVENAQVTVFLDGKSMETKMTNKRGIAHISFVFTNQSTLMVEVIKDDERIVSKHGLTGSRGIKVIPNKENYGVGENVQCDVYYTGSGTTDWVYYDVVANGFVTTTGRLALNDGKGNFSIAATPDMIPLAQIRAYKIQPDLNVTRDTAVIGVISPDTLNVQVYTNQEEYKPHENITLQFTVDNGDRPVVAAMGISIVDKSVFEVSQRFMGLEKLYFGLEKEFITPTYEIHEYVFTNTSRILSLDETPYLVDQDSFKTEENMVLSNPNKYYADAQVFKEKSIFVYWMTLLIIFIVCAVVITIYFAGKVFGKTKMFASMAILGLCVCGAGMFIVMNQALTSDTGGLIDDEIGLEGRDDVPEEFVFINITGKGNQYPLKDSLAIDNGRQATTSELVRHFFPETWYWNPLIITDEEGNGNITLVTPDSITTWNIEAIASTKDAQIGVGSGEVRVFKQFFIDPDIPVAAIRNDEFPLNILVYNYGDKRSTVTVEIDQDEWYNLLSRSKQSLTIQPNSVSSVTFTIRPISVGRHNITITAFSNGDSDAIIKQIQIDPDGKAITQIENGELGNNQTVTHVIPLSSERIPNSENAFIKIQGGMESVILDGAEGFLNFVSGCGEQSMSLLAIDILAYQNLLKKEGITTDQLFKSETMITQGIQHEFLYLVDDEHGRGIVWFPQEENPHPWLTSWGLLTFQDAKNTGFTIDEKIIHDMQNWLINQQIDDGSYKFPEWGLYETTNPILKMKKVATTAYITRALLYSGYEDEDPIRKSLEYIKENINDHWDDPYTLALALIVLEDADGERNLRKKINSQLLLLRNEDNGTVYWGTKNNMYSNTETSRYWAKNTYYTIETTAYAIMALQKHGGSGEIIKGAVSYLLNHRNQMGGFSSTQDTIVALQALNGQGTNEIDDMQIKIYANDIVVDIVNLTEENNDMTFLIDLRPYLNDKMSTVEITAQGKGSILYQVFSEQYLPWDLISLEKPRELIINVSYDSTSIKVSDMLWAHVDLMYNGSAESARMVLIDLRAPVGFSFVSTDFDALVKNDTFDYFEITGRQAVVYIENITRGEWIHFDYQLEANEPIKGTIQGVKAYDMYNPSITAETPPVEITSST